MKWLVVSLLMAALTGSDPAPRAPGPCLPPGVPAFDEWTPAGPPSMVGIRQDGAQRLAFLVAGVFEAGTARIAAAWFKDRPVIVDPEPANEAAPAWYDAGAIRFSGEGLVLLADPRPSCQWTRPDRASPTERTT